MTLLCYETNDGSCV